MFGGLAFLVNGNMCCGVTANDLVLRLSPEAAERALQAPHTRPMDFTGKSLKSMVYVEAEGTRQNASLQKWVRAAIDIVRTLPIKSAKPAAAKSSPRPTRGASKRTR